MPRPVKWQSSRGQLPKPIRGSPKCARSIASYLEWDGRYHCFQYGHSSLYRVCHSERLKPQKLYTPVQSACFPSFGTTTVTARRSSRQVQVQSSTCTSGSGQTTVAARPFGSENDKYVCVGECRVVRMCLLQYCYNETVCNPCVRVVVVIGPD